MDSCLTLLTIRNQIQEFQSLRKTWHLRERTTVAQGGQVLVRWIPGHQKIPGNVRADSFAKSVCGEDILCTTIIIAWAERLDQDRYTNYEALNLQNYALDRYRKLNIEICTKVPPESSLIHGKASVNISRPVQVIETL